VNEEKVKLLRERIEMLPHDGHISFYEGAIPALPFKDGTFDLVWSSRVVHHVADQIAGVRELIRITKPGGRVALREAGIAPRFLPIELGIGEDGLEDRIRVAQNVWFRKHREEENGVACPLGWTGILRAAGLEKVTAKSFLYELLPPFSEGQVSYLENWLRDYGTHEDVPLSDEDRRTILAITDPTSEHYVMQREDLHFLYVESVFVGVREG
jgi:SAM-dependent methyltransferase